MTSLVNTETGEILNVEAAERRASYICTDLDFAATSLEGAMARMREAIAERDDLALGYRSPGDYLSDRFGGRLARLGVDLRREVVKELTEAGMSTRAIAPVLGVSKDTVQRDQSAGVSRETPKAPEGEECSDSGKTAESDQPQDAAAPRPPVIGIDGKAYTRPAPIDHSAKADAAVADFPDLAYYRERDPEHCWRLAETLRRFVERGEIDDRLRTLRRSIEIDKAKRAGTYVAPLTSTPSCCPTCGQTIKD